jgi:N-acetylglucosamine malate deacetylase 1
MSNLVFNANRILVVAPHIDDAELGAGGSVRRWTKEGKEVFIVNLSDTSNIHGRLHGERLRAEAIIAASELGIQESHVQFANFALRNFNTERQAILDHLIQIKNTVQPGIVLGPSIGDIHQDHSVVAFEIQRAFKGLSILGFDTYWNMTIQKCEAVMELSEADLDAKIRALSQYSSQSDRPYMKSNAVAAQARIRGLPAGFEFAEAFSISQVVMSAPKGTADA